MVAPNRSLEQRLDALERGNRIRTARAALKRRLHHDHGLELLIEALDTRDAAGLLVEPELEAAGQPPAPDGYLDTMKVYDLLLATSGLGRVKANKVLRIATVSPSKTVAGITDRQRRELVAVLRGEAGRRRITSRRFTTERTPA